MHQIPLLYNLRSLWVRRTTTFATAAGIALVVFVLASSLMLAQGLRTTLALAGSPKKLIVLDTNGYAEGDSRLKQAALTHVAAAPGIARAPNGEPLAVGEVVGHVYLQQVNDATTQASIQIRGVTPRSFELRPQVQIVSGRMPAPGTDEAIVGRGLLSGNYAGVQLGQGFELKKNRRVELVGVFEAGGSAFESEVWADIDSVRQSIGSAGYVSSITAELDSAAAFDGAALALSTNKQLGLSVLREPDYYARVSNNLAAGITGLGVVVATIFSLGAALGAVITLYGSVSQRTRELGVLRALGFRRSHILAGVVLEAAALAIVGGLCGLGLSLLTPLLDVSVVNWATGQQIVFRFEPRLPTLLVALGAGTAVGILAGLFPAVQAARIDPVRAMRVG